MPAFGIFYQRMYRTLNPKPADVKEAFITVRKMWGELGEAQKEVRPFRYIGSFRCGAPEGLLDRVPTLPVITFFAPTTTSTSSPSSPLYSQ
jgi:hypothetical protein